MLTLACLLTLSTPPMQSRIAALVASEGRVSEAQWSSLDQGRVITKTLDTADRSEVVTLAAVRVAARLEDFLACARDVSCLKQNEDSLGAGRLSTSPGPEELASLSLDARDVEYLRRCRAGECDVRLGREEIARFEHGVDWSASGHASAAEALFREIVAERGREYASHGVSSLPAYHDNAAPVPVAATLSDLVGRRYFPLDLVPGGRSRMEPAPAARVGGPDEFLGWYQERFWRKSLVALVHVSVWSADAVDEDLAVAVSRQLYSSHYFDGAVDLTLFTAPPGTNRGLLVFLSRVRADIRPSGFTWLERLLINRLVRRRMEGQLRSMRDRLQSDGAMRAAGTQTPAGTDTPRGNPRR